MAYISFKPTDHFNPLVFNGTGGAQAVTGVGFQPDFVWGKSSVSNHHQLLDVVRGVGKPLESNSTDAEHSDPSSSLSAFDSDGFTLAGGSAFNPSGTANILSLNWKAGGAGASNTDGSLTSTISANTTSGFSICKWTGTGSVLTVGHGLGKVPAMIFVKCLSHTGDWVVYHQDMGNTGGMEMPSNGMYNATSAWFNDTTPTSSVFTIGTNGNINTSARTYIAYCFAEVKGFSSIRSYRGTGDVAGGAYVPCGFRPAMVIIKRFSGSGSDGWYMVEDGNNPFNRVNKNYFVNSNGALSTAGTSAGDKNSDFFANGFKIRTSNSEMNTTSEQYLYLAFASHPTVGNNGIPGLAR